MKKTLAISLVGLVTAFGSFSTMGAAPRNTSEAIIKLTSGKLDLPKQFNGQGSLCSPTFHLNPIKNISNRHVENLLTLFRVMCIPEIKVIIHLPLQKKIPSDSFNHVVSQYTGQQGNSFTVTRFLAEVDTQITLALTINTASDTVSEDITEFVTKVVKENVTENGNPVPIASYIDGKTTSINSIDKNYVLDTVLPVASISGTAKKGSN